MRSNLEKLRIIRGNDMHPAISPSEYLLMDRSAPPKPGDVVVFENKFGCRVAHRLIHEIAGFYFTKGDNCPLFNFPFRRDRLWSWARAGR
jgi:signal peptidase I